MQRKIGKIVLEIFRWIIIVICYSILAWSFYYILVGFFDGLSSPSPDDTEYGLW